MPISSSWRRCDIGTIRGPPARAASAPFATGTASARAPACRAASAIGSTPGTERIEPFSASSPTNARPSSFVTGSCSDAPRSAAAIARSSPGPPFRRSAGARFAVMRCCGNLNPEFPSAARTRSRDSRIAASGRPTIENEPSPACTSTSTRTGRASTPRSVNV